MSSTGESLITTVLEDVPVEKSGKYFFSCQVKLVNVAPGCMWHKVIINALLKSNRTRNAGTKRCMAQMPQMTPEDGWVDIEGDIQVDQDTTKMTIQVSSDADVKYEVDEPELSQIVVNENWKEQANRRIDKIRKGDITINVDISDEFDPSKVVIKVKQLSHSFPWGTCVKAGALFGTSAADKAYTAFFLKHFKWATFENSMKWRFMTPTEGKTVFSTVDRALDVLIPNGIKVRGHCIAWGKSTKVPVWLRSGDAKRVEEAVSKRIDELADHYQGVFAHYDVCNEQLHGDWYEQKTKDPHYIDQMFLKSAAQDDTVDLCLNDYDVCSKGIFTSAYRRQGLSMVERGVPVSYLGIQSHMGCYPDVDLLTKRLQILAETGIPLFITELDVRQEDIELRAQGYEDILRLYFSHPSVHGIIIWGFWKENISYETAALAEGKKNIKWNQAGEKVHHLWTKEWQTTEKLRPQNKEESFEFRGFFGEYELNLEYDGETQWTHSFSLEEGKDVNIDVNV
ncbi:hypothetical protein CAPTEDRAFT_222166 [Capitella teleta]|uniref:GH10 domain-containing protein n=1 Tax=Capitella teleta TaxID=283909 RepID=X2ASX4_CAPTE|nr:hypothetical protein CAPTEDRAFT_222166 [Capitella teleta]|eukprot:ELT88419.1 hypothetical protein CAPTEDRAFT_222166 [Capitella teleta]